METSLTVSLLSPLKHFYKISRFAKYVKLCNFVGSTLFWNAYHESYYYQMKGGHFLDPFLVPSFTLIFISRTFIGHFTILLNEFNFSFAKEIFQQHILGIEICNCTLLAKFPLYFIKISLAK